MRTLLLSLYALLLFGGTLPFALNDVVRLAEALQCSVCSSLKWCTLELDVLQWRRQDWRKGGAEKEISARLACAPKFLMPCPLISAACIYFCAIATPTRPHAQKLK